MPQFFIDLLKRFAAETPWFFRVLQYALAIVALILVVPDVINAINQGGFTLPETWTAFVGKMVGYASIAQIFLFQLTATSEDKAEKGIKD